MDNSIKENNYRIDKPAHWGKQISDEDIKSWIVDTDFSKKWMEEGRDFCYFLYKNYYTSEQEDGEYNSLAYTLNEPSNLERASVFDVVLEESEFYIIHRISVFREGILIDKIPDINIKVLDDENNSGGGVINSYKKINVTIKDLRLYDILILEDSKQKIFTDRDFIKKDFARKILVSPDVYWAYGIYDFTFINEREKEITVKNNFFRDENGKVEESKIITIKKGEHYEDRKTNYFNPVDPNRQIYPFTDFATQSTWKELSNFIYPFYQKVYNKKSLAEFAPELVEKFQSIDNKDEQLQYALDYVQNHIHYIYNAVEMNGHKPEDPEITYNIKQGDCKAKTVLLKVILDYLEIESSVVLVNYNVDFYFKYYLPSLLIFNHVIVKINYKGEEYFVDATLRDEFGRIENRGFLYFKYYLEINPDQDLKIRSSYEFKKYCIDEKVTINVTENIGRIELQTKYWGNRANNMRRYFKNTSKREILDSWNNFLFSTLNYVNDRKGTDPRKVFQEASIEIVQDNKDENEFKILYQATIDKPYFEDSKGNRFLMYFDYNIIKNKARNFIHEDIPFWIGFDSEKYEVNLNTDQKIDTNEKYTIQEAQIHNKYFDYVSRKNIKKNGGSIYIEFNPQTNIEVEKENFEQFRLDHEKIADSNFGLGVDILKKGLLSNLFSIFK